MFYLVAMKQISGNLKQFFTFSLHICKHIPSAGMTKKSKNNSDFFRITLLCLKFIWK